MNMTKISMAVLSALLVAGASPAFAKDDCNAEYKTFLGKMSPYVATMSGYELADVVRKSLKAYDSCAAGDNFSLHGVFDQLEADMAAKGKK